MTIRVLIADDHAVVREGLRLVLETKGRYTVVGEAENGRKAIEAVRETKPDVVIMDIAMPDLNGIEATSRILEFAPKVRVLILSMYATSEHVYRALRCGATGYLLKESAGKEVVEAVRAVYAGRRYLSERITDTMIQDYLLTRESLPEQSPLEKLSSREREVLQLVVEGKSSAEIAKLMHLSPKTVETYRSRIMQKLSVEDLPSLIRFAIANGVSPR